MVVSGTDVYAAGYSNDSSDKSVPGYWKNGTWVPLPRLSANASLVYSLVLFGNDVYAGGYSNNSNGGPVPGYWKNGTWVPLPELSSGVTVLSLVVK
jgi:hypothetical protein